MAFPVLAIIGALAMGLAVVSSAVNIKTIVELETDRYYVAETEKLLSDQYSAAAEKLEIARFQNDTMAIAEYEALLKNISLLRDRSNVSAIGRQVEQKKSAFIEEQWSVFVADTSISAVTWGLGKVGFGKVADNFMLGRNWPPKSSVAVWNPLAGQTQRIILGSKPELMAVEFSDELADFMSAILNGFDVARSASAPEDIRLAADANTFVMDELAKMGNLRPLPSEIGDYLASSIIKKIIRENPQLAGESDLTRAIFGRQQACTRLQKLWQEEQSDVIRSEGILHAMNRLECDKLIKPVTGVTEEVLPTEAPPATEEPGAIPQATEPPPPVAPSVGEPVTSAEIPAGTYIGTIEFSEDWYTYAESITSEVFLDVAEDGTVTGTFAGQIFQTPYASGNCTIHWEYVLVGELNGSLTGAEGRITSTESMDFYPNVNTGCTETFETASGSYTRGIQITVAGDTLTGTTDPRPDNPDQMFILRFSASKQ